ncbi:MAG: hypothetical protein ACI9KA_000670 [Parasphingorhabdus sp.]|jgi:hypothetical protein|uniref:sulfotransferase domain-containing protein n=1 Tax=Parasphingorhabdus sp. TaxID=2709688 RepID=UPI0039E70B72
MTQKDASGLQPSLRPNLLGIGAAKCGTTWFADQLSSHQDIFLPPQKELGALYYNDLEDRLQEYQAYFVGAEDARVRCDFSVRYLSEPNASAAAARHTPDTRVLVILRDPVDQVQSHYWHQVRQNFSQPKAVKPQPDIFEAIERFPKLLLEPALYGKHLRRWLERFPEDRVLVLDYGEVAKDLPAALAKVWAFLDLAPAATRQETQAPNREGRRGVSPRGGLLGSIYPPLYSAVTHKPYQAAKRIFGVRRVEAVKRKLKLRQFAEAIFFESGYPKLSLEDRLRLRAIFADDLKILDEELGFAPAAVWRVAP